MRIELFADSATDGMSGYGAERKCWHGSLPAAIGRISENICSAVQIQSEYAKTSFEGFVAQATKMSELYSNIAKSASIRLDWRWPTPKA
jgi:Phasin protein